jgi:hypothetical protein
MSKSEHVGSTSLLQNGLKVTETTDMMLLFQPGSQLGCWTIFAKPARISRNAGLSSGIHNGAG